MRTPITPLAPRAALRGMVVAADQLAASAGVAILERKGTAADAIVAAAAVMAVTSPHLCGMGGDLLAMVSPPQGPPRALLAAGRAGSGADPNRLRNEGHTVMPLRHDIRSVTVPGAVDGWLELHARYGRLPLGTILAPAIGLAEEGFAASGLLALASFLVADIPGAKQLCPGGPLQANDPVRLPGVARTLRAVVDRGRDGFYLGEVGQALLALGPEQFGAEDLARPLGAWVEPLRLRVWDHDVWTAPPPSQGYLTLASCWIAEQVGLPVDPSDPLWAHLIVESARAAGHDRPSVLYDGADGQALLAEQRLSRVAGRVAPDRAAPSDTDESTADPGSSTTPRLGDGDTTHLCALDFEGLGISLTQSNALDFGAHIVAGETSVFLHNRGLGFSLEPGHVAELTAGRRPPHTLSPALVTRADGTLAHLIGTMGGDGQPQILVQLLARLLHSGQDPATSVAAGRLVLDAPSAGPFRLWFGSDLTVRIESDVPSEWSHALETRGHRVEPIDAAHPVLVGCAQIVSSSPSPTDGGNASRLIFGGSDPRSPEGGAVGW